MIIGKSAARSSRRNVGDRPKTMCRQTLRNEVPEAGKPALSCLPNRACVSVRILHVFRIFCSRSFRALWFSCCTGESPIAPRRSWAKADNPFWSNHVAAWYRSALDAEHYCRKHDLSTASLIRWARHLLSAEDLRRKCAGKSGNGGRRTGHRNGPRGLGAIVAACVRTAVRLRYARSGAYMWRR